MVVRATAPAADLVPATDAAMLDRLRVRGWRWRVGVRVSGDSRARDSQEPGLDHAVVGPVVGRAKGLRLPVPAAQSHVHALRIDALDGLQQAKQYAEMLGLKFARDHVATGYNFVCQQVKKQGTYYVALPVEDLADDFAARWSDMPLINKAVTVGIAIAIMVAVAIIVVPK